MKTIVYVSVFALLIGAAQAADSMSGPGQTDNAVQGAQSGAMTKGMKHDKTMKRAMKHDSMKGAMKGDAMKSGAMSSPDKHDDSMAGPH